MSSPPETPPEEIVPTRIPVHEWTWITDPRIPATPLQALMQAAPGDDPVRSEQEMNELRDAVLDCFTVLDKEQQYIVEAVIYEGMSHRKLATRLGLQKTHTHRLFRRALDTMSALLRSQPVVQERFPALKPETWDQAAEDAVNQIRIASVTQLAVPYSVGVTRGKELLHAGWDNIPELRELLIGMGATAYTHIHYEDSTAVDTIVPTLIDRHHKYGPGNIAEFREVGLLVRMADKVARIRNNTGDFADEAYIDAFVDLIGYAAICVMLRDDTFFLPLNTKEQ